MSRTSLWQLFESNYKRQNRSCANTVKQYRVVINHFREFLGHEPTLDDLTDDLLEAFLADRASKVAAPTANKAYWCIVALWRRAYDLGMVKTRPTVQPLIEPENVPFAWFKDEIRILLRTCTLVPGEIDGIPARLWWPGIHWTIWSCGERIGAILAVEKTWADLQRGTLYVPAHARKGRKKAKIYPLLPQAVHYLREMNRFDRKLLFPFPLCIQMLYRRYKKILLAAGLPHDRKCKFHRMRRSFASYVTAAGGNATELLDHSSPLVTRRSYNDPRICGEQDATKFLPKLDDPEAA